MARGNKIGITAALDDQVTGKLGKIRDQFDRLGNNAGAKALLQGVGIGAGVTAFNLLGDAVAGVAGWFGESVGKAIEEEKSIAKLTTSLKANIAGYDGNVDAIEKVIAEREKLAFSDDEQRDSLALLVARTHDVNKALDLERQAMDLARLKGIDLATSAEVIGKVYSGNVSILKRYGIAVKAGATSTEALAEVQAATAGQAEAFADTAAGSMQAVQISIEDLQEEIGQELLPVVKDLSQWALNEGVPALRSLTQAAKDLGPWVSGFLDVMDGSRDNAQEFVDGIRASELAAAEYTEALTHADEALIDFRKSERDQIGTVKDVAGETKDLAEANADAAKGFEAIRSRARAATKALHDTVEAVEDARDALIEASFGPKELTLKLDGAKLKGKDLRDELKELEGKKPTRSVREDIIDTQLAIIDNKEDVIRLQGELVSLGKISLKTHENTILRLGDNWGEADDELRTYLRDLSRVPGVKVPAKSTSGTGAGGKRQLARGGYAPPGSSGTVGEEGIEDFHVLPTGGVVVTPRASGGGGESVVVHTHINLDGRQIAEVVDRHLYYEQARAPQTLTSR